MMQGLEEDEMVRDELKMPDDLEGDYDDEEEGEEEGLFPEDNGSDFPVDEEYEQKLAAPKKAVAESDEDDLMERVFEQANDNREMDIVEQILNSKGEFINQEKLKQIEAIEDEMMNPKEWQLTGEARASDRPKDSLLHVHLDFNNATKLPVNKAIVMNSQKIR